MTLSRRAVLVAGVAGAAAVASRPAGAGPPSEPEGAAQATEALIGRIGRARAPVHTLRGPFTQTRTIGLLATDVQSRGTLTLVRPDRLRWELSPPDAVTFWIGPDGMSYRSAHGSGTVQETTARMAAALDDMRTLLAGDLDKLRARWLLRVLRDDATGAELEATPRAPSSGTIRRLRFGLASDLIRPTQVVLVEGLRDHTTIDFGELAVNVPVDEGTMRGG